MNMISRQDRDAVLALLARGYSQRHVARLLSIHPNTVGGIVARRKAKDERRERGVKGRPKLPEGKVKGCTVLMRVTEAEHQAIVHAARNCKSVSEWIRRECRREAKRILGDDYKTTSVSHPHTT